MKVFWNVLGFFYDLIAAIFFQMVRAIDLVFRRLWYPKFGIFESLEEAHDATGKKIGPILLVHGLNMDPFCFWWMRRKLQRHGCGPIFRLGLQPFSWSIAEQARELGVAVAAIHQKFGAPHIIAHSLGGVVARYYIQEIGGDEKVASLVTLGTPHRGTPVARLAISFSGRQLVPTSEVFATLNSPEKLAAFFPNGNPKVPSLFLWAGLDLLVPPRWAGGVPGIAQQSFEQILHEGHTSILVSPRVFRIVMRFITSVVDRLPS